MILDRVAITGADESIDPKQLLDLTADFPFVEWAILLSRSSEGKRPRYPGRKWMDKLLRVADENKNLRWAGHLCGSWVREWVYHGEMTFEAERPDYLPIFSRLQINFHGAEYHQPHKDYWRWLQENKLIQYILQMDGVNDAMLPWALEKKINAVPLFDRSGGDGITPESWPMPWPNLYNGYAGGIGPDNIRDEINRISGAVGGNVRIWIDMESKVRDDQDKFDLTKVRACLEAAKQFGAALQAG
jgi:hypothetical protein